jgi:glycosyltransferase involved in cell wall biosynthesis
MTEVTVIATAYNNGPYIKRCLDSLANQTLKDIKILIAYDTGSKDDTFKICDRFVREHYNAKLLITPHMYLGSSRNYSAAEVNTKYLAFVDGDDAYMPNAMQDMYEAMIKENASMVVGDSLFIYQTGKTRFAPGTFYNKDESEFICGPMAHPMLFEKDEYLKYMKCVENRKTSEDLTTGIFATIFARKPYHLKTLVYEYYVNPGSLLREVTSENAAGIVDDAIYALSQVIEHKDKISPERWLIIREFFAWLLLSKMLESSMIKDRDLRIKMATKVKETFMNELLPDWKETHRVHQVYHLPLVRKLIGFFEEGNFGDKYIKFTESRSMKTIVFASRVYVYRGLRDYLAARKSKEKG